MYEEYEKEYPDEVRVGDEIEVIADKARDSKAVPCLSYSPYTGKVILFNRGNPLSYEIIPGDRVRVRIIADHERFLLATPLEIVSDRRKVTFESKIVATNTHYVIPLPPEVVGKYWIDKLAPVAKVKVTIEIPRYEL